MPNRHSPVANAATGLPSSIRLILLTKTKSRTLSATTRRALGLTHLRAHTLTAFHRVLVCCVLISPISLHAAPVNRELGDGLLYFRAEIIPRDLPPADVKAGPLVLDLRYALAESDASTALNTWLNLRAKPATPVFLLVNSDTAPALKDQLKHVTTRDSVITLGRSTDDFKPDIEIETASDEERRAYDLLAETASIDSLLVENANKPRVDEASIMRARDEAGEELFEANPLDRLSPTDTKLEVKSEPPIDRALQRAVHLHRALRALKRL